jgi:hypothetical protein
VSSREIERVTASCKAKDDGVVSKGLVPDLNGSYGLQRDLSILFETRDSFHRGSFRNGLF